VVERDCGTGTAAAVPGVRVAGKTGTAPLLAADGSERPDAWLSSFVGLLPADDPDFVVLVAVEAAHTDAPWGGRVAAPAFARIAAGLR
jgi:cell division protein FtsI/penicillin-binding protein 2